MSHSQACPPNTQGWRLCEIAWETFQVPDGYHQSRASEETDLAAELEALLKAVEQTEPELYQRAMKPAEAETLQKNEKSAETAPSDATNRAELLSNPLTATPRQATQPFATTAIAQNKPLPHETPAQQSAANPAQTKLSMPRRASTDSVLQAFVAHLDAQHSGENHPPLHDIDPHNCGAEDENTTASESAPADRETDVDDVFDESLSATDDVLADWNASHEESVVEGKPDNSTDEMIDALVNRQIDQKAQAIADTADEDNPQDIADSEVEPAEETPNDNESSEQLDNLLDEAVSSASGLKSSAEQGDPLPVSDQLEELLDEQVAPEEEMGSQDWSTDESADEPDMNDLDTLLAEQADEQIAEELSDSSGFGTFDVSGISDDETPVAAPKAKAQEHPQSDANEEAALSGERKHKATKSSDEKASPATDEGDAIDAQPRGESRRFRRPLVGLARDAISPQGLKQVCIVLNKPITRCSPQTRNLVGYAGLVTLFNAMAFILYAILK